MIIRATAIMLVAFTLVALGLNSNTTHASHSHAQSDRWLSLESSGSGRISYKTCPASPPITWSDGVEKKWDQSYNFVIWARCNTTCTGGFQVRLVVWGLSGSGESDDTIYTVPGLSWKPIVVPLDVEGNSTAMRAQIYLRTTNTYLNVDAAGSSVAVGETQP